MSAAVPPPSSGPVIPPPALPLAASPPALPCLVVDTVEVITVTRSLRDSVRTAAGTHTARPICFLRVAGPDGEGWGECGALPDGTLVDPPLATVVELLQTVVIPELRRTGTMPPVRVSPTPRDGPRVGIDPAYPAGSEHPADPAHGEDPALRMAWATAEMAVLDAVVRREGQSLAAWLGVPAGTRVPIGGMVAVPDPGPAGHGLSASLDAADRSATGAPLARDLGALLEAADRASAGGVRRLRVKIWPGWDWEPLSALRSRFPDLVLQADANGAYRPGTGELDDADQLRRLDDLALTCIEQPLPPEDLVGSGRLAERLRTPIALDESLRDLGSLRRALAMGACQVACLKPARLGGVAATLEAAALCRQTGVPTFIGGFFEAGLGRLANAALAAAGASTLPADLSPPASYLDQDPCGYPPTVDGWLALPTAPGVGPPPRPGPTAGEEGRPA